MLFKSLALKNFKCFEEVEVEFAPITLLTGANSSGKSSLIYSLLAMLQTEQFPLYLSPNGKYVDMGSFKEMVFQGDLNKIIEIKIDYSISRTLNSLIGQWESQKDENTLFIHYLKVIILNSKYELEKNQNNNYIFKTKTTHNWDEEGDGTNISMFISKEIFNNFQEIKDVLFHLNSLNIKELEKQFKSESVKGSGLKIIQDFFYQTNDNLNYLSPFRLSPEPNYRHRGKSKKKIGINDEGYINQIIKWRQTCKEKIEELNKNMAYLGLAYSIPLIKIREGYSDLGQSDNESDLMTAIRNSGSGVSHFLPILVADLQLAYDSCLLLSQPELGLHPKNQALFGNYLANKISKSSKQYIIETHSEYLLNRIRLLLIKGEMKPQSVRIYYFENNGNKSTIHQIKLTKDGQIKSPPDGFFDTYGMDVMDIALNA